MTDMIKFDDKTLDENVPKVIEKLAKMSTADLALLRAAEVDGKTRQGVIDAVDLELQNPERLAADARNNPLGENVNPEKPSETSQISTETENKNEGIDQGSDRLAPGAVVHDVLDENGAPNDRGREATDDMMMELATTPVPPEFYDADGKMIVMESLVEILAAHLPAAQQRLADRKEALTEQEQEQAMEAADQAMRDQRAQAAKSAKAQERAVKEAEKVKQLRIDAGREALGSTILAVEPEDRALFRDADELILLLSNGDHFHPDLRVGLEEQLIIKTAEGISYNAPMVFDGSGPAFDIEAVYLFIMPDEENRDDPAQYLALRCEFSPPLKTGDGSIAQIPAGSLYFRT